MTTASPSHPFLFRYGGLVCQSDLPLGSLVGVLTSSEAAAIHVHRGHGDPPVRPHDEGREWLSITGDGQGVHLHFRDLATFTLESAGRIRYWPQTPAGSEVLNHLLLDHVLPRAVGREGRLVLHASALAIDGVAVAFLGPSGAGKSALALALLRRGGSLLSDDALVLDTRFEPPRVSPTYRALRLWPDVAASLPAEWLRGRVYADGEKRWVVPPGTDADGDLPLARLYLLEPEPCPTVQVTAIAPAEFFVRASEQAFHAGLVDRPSMMMCLDQIAHSELWRSARRLRHSRSLGDLDQVTGAILADLQGA